MLFWKRNKAFNSASYCRVGTYEQLKCEGLKVVIYARNSNRKGLDEQVRKLVNYCEDNRFKIVAIKKEIGRGRKYFRFPLKSALRNKNAEAIVVTDLSRFSRNLVLSMQLLNRVYENNKFLISADCDEIINSTNEQYLQSFVEIMSPMFE